MSESVKLSEIVLPGEGDVVTVTKRRVRETCEECGEVAVYKQSYLLDGGRSNPASSAYRGDDVSWCSDKDLYLCESCPSPNINGYRKCSRFTVSDRFKHMFLKWEEVK